MTAHTPGPWVVKDSTQVTSDGRHIADCAGRETTTAIGLEDSANARLIAAAPDLLAALEKLLHLASEDWHEASPTLREAAGAIAKARGEDECMST